MRFRKIRVGIIAQVAILFLLGVLVTGLLTYFTEQELSGERVKRQTEQFASQIADEVKRSVQEYPAWEWLLPYWYDHADELDIDYDEFFTSDSSTAAKARQLQERQPDFSQVYAERADVEALPEADQKLYAEIVYSWVTTRIDQIKQAYHIDFLFCVVTEEPYDSQFFLFSGADPDAVRGTEYLEVYPLGHVVSVNENQQKSMIGALENNSHLAEAGNYMDYYADFHEFDGHTVLLGMTYNLSGLRADMKAQSRVDTAVVILNQIGLSLICLTLLYVFVLYPLKEVLKNIRAYRDDKDGKEVVRNLARVHPPNEIGQLAEDMSDLAIEIDEHLARIETITAERERVGTELNMATQIQRAMLPGIFPPYPERKDFDIFASMDPAREVGGDFYDFFLIDDDHLCMVMADVSGKGVPAALFMMASKIVLASNAKMGKSPAQVLTDANTSICRNNPQDMFVTVWLGILELSTGKLTAASAGHEYPVLKQPDGRYEVFKDRHGLVLGAMPGMKYKEYELSLRPGAKLFLYTDGVPEASNAAQELFGMDRMLDALNGDAGASPTQTLKNVRKAVDDFVLEAEQFDDLTMLCMAYHGPETR